MFIRTESYRKYFKSYLLSTITIIIISAVMIYMVFSSNNPYEVGGIQRGVLETGEYWRFVTYAFLHHNVYHYLFNAGAILIFGPPLEEKLGKTRFLMLIIGTVILTPIPLFLQHLLQELEFLASYLECWGFIYSIDATCSKMNLIES